MCLKLSHQDCVYGDLFTFEVFTAVIDTWTQMKFTNSMAADFFGCLAVIKEQIRKWANINHSKNIEMKEITKVKVVMKGPI